MLRRDHRAFLKQAEAEKSLLLRQGEQVQICALLRKPIGLFSKELKSEAGVLAGVFERPQIDSGNRWIEPGVAENSFPDW